MSIFIDHHVVHHSIENILCCTFSTLKNISMGVTKRIFLRWNHYGDANAIATSVMVTISSLSPTTTTTTTTNNNMSNYGNYIIQQHHVLVSLWCHKSVWGVNRTWKTRVLTTISAQRVHVHQLMSRLSQTTYRLGRAEKVICFFIQWDLEPFCFHLSIHGGP